MTIEVRARERNVEPRYVEKNIARVRLGCEPVVVQLKALVKIHVVDSISNSQSIFNLPFSPLLLSSEYLCIFPLNVVVRLGNMDC